MPLPHRLVACLVRLAHRLKAFNTIQSWPSVTFFAAFIRRLILSLVSIYFSVILNYNNFTAVFQSYPDLPTIRARIAPEFEAMARRLPRVYFGIVNMASILTISSHRTRLQISILTATAWPRLRASSLFRPSPLNRLQTLQSAERFSCQILLW